MLVKRLLYRWWFQINLLLSVHAPCGDSLFFPMWMTLWRGENYILSATSVLGEVNPSIHPMTYSLPCLWSRCVCNFRYCPLARLTEFPVNIHRIIWIHKPLWHPAVRWECPSLLVSASTLLFLYEICMQEDCPPDVTITTGSHQCHSLHSVIARVFYVWTLFLYIPLYTAVM